MSSTIVNMRLDFGYESPVPVFGHVCRWWKSKQPLEEGHQMQVVGRWTCADRSGMKAYPFVYPVTLVCHLLTGGPLGFLVLDDRVASAQEKKAMEAEFLTCKNDNKALVALQQLPGGKRCEFLLAPILGQSGGESVGVFGVYATSIKCGHFLLSRVIRKERIPLILDLDETLVKAHTINQLEKKYDSSRSRKAQTRARSSTTEKDCENLLYKDRMWIKRFAETEDVMVGDVVYRARNVNGMYSSHDGNTFRDIIRPVIDLQFVSKETHRKYPLVENLFLTKILADQKQTTVLARTRPGWREAYDRLAHATLSGEEEPRLAVEVFIATTAEKNYAHEIWRALDFESALIPETERSERIVAGMDKKNLAKSLRCLNPNPLVNPMNLAIILDDRTDVWDRLYHKQILKSDVYDPYSPDHSDPARMRAQMEHFVDVILEARNQFFSYLKRQGLLLFGDSHPYKEFDVDCLEEEYFANLGSIPTMSDILAQIVDTTHEQDTFERIQPSMLSAVVSDIKTPSDPRKRHAPMRHEEADPGSDAKQQVFNPSTDIFHEPEMADVPQMGDTDPNMTIVALQREDRSIDNIEHAASDVLSRETCTQGGSLNSHPQENKSTHERMSELASSMGYVVSSKCEWLNGINTATISIVDPCASVEEGKEKKGLLIGMCSGVDAMTAVAGASESGLKYLENIAALRRVVGNSERPVKTSLDDVEAGLEVPEDANVVRKCRWDVRPPPSLTSQEHKTSGVDDSMNCEVEKEPEQTKADDTKHPPKKSDEKEQSGSSTKREITRQSTKDDSKLDAIELKKKKKSKAKRDRPPLKQEAEKKPTQTQGEATLRPMKREMERLTTSSKRTRHQDEKEDTCGSRWGSGLRLDSEVYSESNGTIQCHVCNTNVSGRACLDEHDKGRRHQRLLRKVRRAQTRSKSVDSERVQTPRTLTNKSRTHCRILDETRRKCTSMARDMGVKLFPGAPYSSKGDFEAKIHGEAITGQIRFGKRTLGFGFGPTRDEALINAYEKSCYELRRIRDQEPQVKLEKYPRGCESTHQGDSLGQPNFSFNTQ